MKKNLLTWIVTLSLLVVCVCLLPTQAQAATSGEATIISCTGTHTFDDENDIECNICGQELILLQLDSNGGTSGGTSISQYRIAANQTSVLPSIGPTRSGYNFAGWSTTRAGDALYQPSDVFQTDQSVTLYAQWNKRCSACSGAGKVECSTCSGAGVVKKYVTCDWCNGGMYQCVACHQWLYKSQKELIWKHSSKSGLSGDTVYLRRYIVEELHSPCSLCKINKDVTIWVDVKYDDDVFYYDNVSYDEVEAWRAFEGIYVECKGCDGAGEVYREVRCTKCDGSRKVDCSSCAGSGEVVRKNVSAPSAPTLNSVNENSVTLNTISNGEYSLDGTTWQDSPIFENLEIGREYSFYQRSAKTDTAYASAASAVLKVVAHNHIYDGGVCSACNAVKGNCGDEDGGANLTWTLDEEGTLIISGTGKMADYSSASDVPWYNVRSAIKNIIIEAEVTSISDWAFCACAGLTSVTIGDGVTSIGSQAFYQCNYLTDVIIGKNVTSIGCQTFAYCSSLTSITIPDSVTNIDIYAFQDCGLTNVTISKGVSNINVFAFSYCSKLIGIWVDEDNPSYSSDDNGVLFNKDKTVLCKVPTGIMGSYTIPDSVTTIGPAAFSYCSHLSSVTISDDVTSIGNYAFNNCTSLRAVFYRGSETEKDNITVGSNNTFLRSCTWHYEVVDSVFASQDCYYCASCNNYFLQDGGYVKATIAFKNWDGTVLSKKTYRYGNAITIPANPTKAADNTYTYTFAGWDTEVVANCAGNATYTATYTSTPIDYTVVFKDWNGDVLSTKTYHYGDAVTAPTNPTKAADNAYTYTFAGWNKPVVNCAGNATYTATYTSTPIEYTVAFKNWNGTVLSTNTYHYGDEIIVPADPTKEADNTHTYTFAGWDKAVVNCAGNATYTAIYTPNYIDYTVVFKDWDGMVLSTKTYHYGDAVTEPATPTKPADNTYTYTFAGWDKEIVDCIGNAIYTATYTSNYIDYTVVFKNWNGEVLSTKTYHYGGKVMVPANPTKTADNTYTYTFDGWDKDVVNCEGNATYTAQYTSTYKNYTITFENWDGSVLSTKAYHWGDTVTVPPNPTKAADNTYTYTFTGWDKTVGNCAGNATYTATYKSSYINYKVTFKNWDGTVLSSKTYHWGDTVAAPANPTRAADNTYTYAFNGWDCEVVVNCAGNATYTATYTSTYIDYTVTFKNWDGSVLDSDQYHYNDTVTPPSATPTRPEDSTYKYVFKGWDSEIVRVIGNKIYTAIYDAIKKIVEITSNVFHVQGNSIGKVGTGTSASSFISKLDQAENVKVYKGNTQVSGNTAIGTGMEVKLMDGNAVVKNYAVVVTGDTNGDGAISVTDMIAVKAHVLKKTLLTGAYAEAGDTSNDNAISITDFIQVKAQILGKSSVVPN